VRQLIAGDFDFVAQVHDHEYVEECVQHDGKVDGRFEEVVLGVLKRARIYTV